MYCLSLVSPHTRRRSFRLCGRIGTSSVPSEASQETGKTISPQNWSGLGLQSFNFPVLFSHSITRNHTVMCVSLCSVMCVSLCSVMCVSLCSVMCVSLCSVMCVSLCSVVCVSLCSVMCVSLCSVMCVSLCSVMCVSLSAQWCVSLSAR